ncbi:class II SORL domain-containing protein [Chloroflexota bacterium]
MPLQDILHDVKSEGKEKHVPVIEILRGKGEGGADVVRVTVGKETPHPNTVEHHIEWIELFGVKEGGQAIDLGRASFAPTYTSPTTSFQVSLAEFKALYSLSYCNIHGVWESYLEV